MQKRDDVRALLPESGRELFDDIVSGRVLGAGRHIRMIGDMMRSIGGLEVPAHEKFERCLRLGDFFKETRGKSSYAIVTAVNLMTAGFAEAGGETDGGRLIEERVSAFFENSERDTKEIVRRFRNLVENQGIKKLMVFDYSSTVERCVVGLREPVEVYVPESRLIDGGRPFVRPFVEAGHRVHFIADAAMLTVLVEIDAVFIGAETFYPDGSAFNTAGSDLLAEVCKLHGVPYYVLTPLLKIDMRPCEGIFKEVIAADLRGRLAAGWDRELMEKVDFYSLELVRVQPGQITAFVTEQGIIPTPAMFAVAREYDELVNGRGRKR